MACLTPFEPQGEGQTAERYLYSLVMVRNAALGIGCKANYQNIGKCTAVTIWRPDTGKWTEMQTPNGGS